MHIFFLYARERGPGQSNARKDAPSHRKRKKNMYKWSQSRSTTVQMSGHTALEGLEVICGWKSMGWEIIPQITCSVYEWLRIFVDSWIGKLNRISMGINCLSGVAWSPQRRRYATREFVGTVMIIVSVKYGKASNTAAKRESLERVSKRRRADETKCFWLHSA